MASIDEELKQTEKCIIVDAPRTFNKDLNIHVN